MIVHGQKKKSEVKEKSIISFVCKIIRQNKSTLIVKTASLLETKKHCEHIFEVSETCTQGKTYSTICLVNVIY
jgi:hypothetical protein